MAGYRWRRGSSVPDDGGVCRGCATNGGVGRLAALVMVVVWGSGACRSWHSGVAGGDYKP